MATADVEEDLIECYGVGDGVFVDQMDGKTFYTAFRTMDLSIQLGDCVRVKLEADTDDEVNDQFAFGQVLAIYEDSEEEIFVEIRWFLQEHEISPHHKKVVEPKANELLESDALDDIAAGSICEIIDIKGTNSNNRTSGSNNFIVRFLESGQSSALQKVNPNSMLRRGLTYSHYGYAYEGYWETVFGGDRATDHFSIAIQRLHISVIPDSLPCRVFERDSIETYIRNAIQGQGITHPVYICGVPGTGKTATVLATINSLKKEAERGDLPEFSFIEINCLRLKSPADAYTQLWRGLDGQHASPKAALKRLAAYFAARSHNASHYFVPAASSSIGNGRNGNGSNNGNNSNSNGNNTGIDVAASLDRRVTICLVDELDYLLTRDFEVIYNFYSWPMSSNSGFVLIGIANTMDLPERLSTRLNSRSNVSISRLIFKPYNHEQIKEILELRLSELNLEAFDQRAREFVARKAATVAGDLRTALKICQRTIEMYRDQNLEQERQAKKNMKMPSLRLQQQQCEVISIAAATATGSDIGANGESSSSIAKPSGRTVMAMVKDAVEQYKATPFVATVSRACQLDKAILIVMGKYRHITGGGEGDDGGGLDTSMTFDDIWERVGDLVHKIDAERYLTAGTGAGAGAGPTIAVAAAAIAPRTAGSAGVITNTSKTVLYLYMPPMSVFQQALQRLCDQGLVEHSASWRLLAGPRSIVYNLNRSFSYSDLLAALSQDPMMKFCSS